MLLCRLLFYVLDENVYNEPTEDMLLEIKENIKIVFNKIKYSYTKASAKIIQDGTASWSTKSGETKRTLQLSAQISRKVLYFIGKDHLNAQYRTCVRLRRWLCNRQYAAAMVCIGILKYYSVSSYFTLIAMCTLLY